MYYIAALAAVAIVIVVFTQRSDWDLNRYILSADNEGNLNSVPEQYFKDQEDRIMKLVNDKLKNVVSYNDTIGITSAMGRLGIDAARTSYISFDAGGPFGGNMIWRDLNSKHMASRYGKGTSGSYTNMVIRRGGR